MNERIGKYLNDALRHIERIIEKTRSLEYDDFNDDLDTIDIVERNIITFTEALNRIEEREPGFCESHGIELPKSRDCATSSCTNTIMFITKLFLK